MTSLDYLDALLSDGSKLCLVESEQRLVQIVSAPIAPHQLSVYMVKKLYTDQELKDSVIKLYSKFASVIQIKSLSQFGEIAARCALQLKDISSKRHGISAQSNANNCDAITKTLQTVPGLGPKHAKKLLAQFGSLYWNKAGI